MFKSLINFVCAINPFRNPFSKEEVPFKVPEYIIFNVSNFNNWFNDPNNGAAYAHSGIFLRLDKLSESHIVEYLEKCYGITKQTEFAWSTELHQLIWKFHEEIRTNWREELAK